MRLWTSQDLRVQVLYETMCTVAMGNTQLAEEQPWQTAEGQGLPFPSGLSNSTARVWWAFPSPLEGWGPQNHPWSPVTAGPLAYTQSRSQASLVLSVPAHGQPLARCPSAQLHPLPPVIYLRPRPLLR